MAEQDSRRWWFTTLLYGGSHNETARSVFDGYQHFLVCSTRGIVGNFFLFHLTECIRILFKLGLSGALTVTGIVVFISTVVSSNVIHISTGSLILVFSVDFVVPSFPALRKNELVADTVGL